MGSRLNSPTRTTSKPAEGTPLSGPGTIVGGAPKVFTGLGLPPRAFVDRVSARSPTREEVEMLDLPVRAPVIRQLRVVLSDDDRPVEASVLVKGAHLYELQFRRLVPDSDRIQS
jgi:GntR family transcriptional regulator